MGYSLRTVDELLAKKLDRMEQRLGALEQRTSTMATAGQLEALGVRIDKLRGEIIDHTREVELRLATAVHGVLTAVIQDLERRLAECTVPV